MLPALPPHIDPADVFSAVEYYRSLGLLHPADEGSRRAEHLPLDDYHPNPPNPPNQPDTK